MTRKTLIIGLVVATLLLALGGIAAAQQGSVDVRGEPDLEVYTPDNTVSPGEATEFTVQLVNDGEVTLGQETNRQRVTTARNVIVELEQDEDAPIIVSSGPQSVGSVTEQQPTEVPIQLEIPNDAEPGTYELDVDIEYSWTQRVRVGVEDQIDLQTQKSRTTTKEIEIEVDDSARFRIENVTSSMRVGEEGEITGEVTNIGGEDATNAEVSFPTENENLFPLETAVAVGDIPAGESAAFRIPIEAGSEAEPVRKRFDLPVSFRNPNGIRVTDDNPEFLAEIQPKRSEFLVTAVDRNVTAGENRQFELEVTNNRDQQLTDIEPKLFVDSPLDSSDSEAFIGSLDPGESTTVTFDLSATSGATTKTYPITIDFRYDDASGQSQISESYRLPIDIQPAQEGGIPTWLFGIGLLGIGGGVGYVWYRRQ
jgi:hypothetical protein